MNEYSDSWNTETNTKLKEDKSDSYEIQSFRNIWDILSRLFEPQCHYKIRLNNPFAIIWGLNETAAAAAAKSLQSCPTLCDLIDGSPPGSSVPGSLQTRTLEWAAISFSNAWKWKVKVKSLSRVRLLATPWTAAYQAPPSMGFSRQEYWSGVPLPSPRDMGGRFKRDGIYVYPWLIHVEVWQKATKFCKAIILQ